MTITVARLMLGSRLVPPRGSILAQSALPLLVALGAGVMLGSVAVNGGVKMAVLAIAGLALGVAVLLRPRFALLVAVALTMTVPDWTRVGVEILPVYRLAALLALVVVLDAAPSRWTAVDTAFAALVTYEVAALWFSPPVPGGERILINELTPAAFYVGARLWWRGEAATLLWTILGAAVIGALTVVRESLHGSVIYLDAKSYSWNADSIDIFRPGGVFSSPPGAATVLAMATLACLPLVRMYSGRLRLLAIAGEAVCVVALVLTYTRTGLISFAVGGIVYLVLSRSPLLRPGPLVVAGLGLLAALVVAFPLVAQSRDFQLGVLRKGNLGARESIWSLAMPIATHDARSAIIGVGLNSTLTGRLGGDVPALITEAPIITSHGTHNQYVLTLLEQGAVGLFSLVTWLLCCLVAGIRQRGDPVAAGFTAGVVAFAITGLANNALLHTPSFAFLALATGTLAAISARSPRERSSAPFVAPR